jgi:hypothetical protein
LEKGTWVVAGLSLVLRGIRNDPFVFSLVLLLVLIITV